MTTFETIWRFAVTSLAVWRLSRVVFGATVDLRGDAQEDRSAGRFWSGRAVDLACWISVWLSSQTALWIAFGFAGVFLSWLSMAGISRLLLPAPTEVGSRTALGAEGPCLGCVDRLQAHHG